MSQESVELAIGKAILNAEFRDLLFAKPQEALSGFNLTADEKRGLLRLDFETLEFIANILNSCLYAENHIPPLRKKFNTQSE